MRRKIISIVILSTLLVMQFSSQNLFENNLFTGIEPTDKPDTVNDPIIMKSIGAGGEEQVRKNIVPNGDFEEIDQNGGPSQLYYYADTEREIDDTYSDRVHSGSYSGLVKATGSNIEGSQGNLNRYYSSPYPYLDQSLNFNLWYYIVSNPDILTSGTVNLYFYVYDSGSATAYSMYYFLSASGSSVVSNSTNRASFNLNSSFGQWHQLSRSITNDFTSRFGAPSATTYINWIYFQCYSPNNPTGYTEFVIDDASLRDISTTEFLPNGDFEDGVGGYWSGQSSGPCSVQQTDDHVEGSYALNLTAVSKYDNGYGYSSLDHDFGDGSNPSVGYYANDDDDFVIDLDWKYSDTLNGGSSQYAYLSVYAENDSYSMWVYLFFGYSNDVIGWGNWSDASSSSIILPAPGFGNRGTWEHLSFDMYEYFKAMNFVNLAIVDMWIEAASGTYANSSVELLLDNWKATTYITGDPSFEEAWYSTASSPIVSWLDNNAVPQVQQSTDAHTGSYSAKTRSNNGIGTMEFYRNIQNIEVSNSLYTDFWWKLNTMTAGSGQAYSSILIQLEGGYSLYYLIGTANVGFFNDTSIGYIETENMGTTGTWFNLVRNLKSDLDAVFGSKLWNITRLALQSYSTGSGTDAEAVFDDIHFVDDTIGPVVTSIVLQNKPMYYVPAIIEINVTDALGEVQDVYAYYNLGTGWDNIAATYSGGLYIATLPVDIYGKTVSFFIVAYDLANNMVVDDNGGLDYSYFIDDDVDPTIAFNVPVNESTVSNDVALIFDVTEIGSGVAYIEIYDGILLMQNITSMPLEYLWDSRTTINGMHTLTATVYDNAGNSATAKIIVDVQNDFLGPEMSLPYINPTDPEYFEEVQVYVSVMDESVLDSVVLTYRIGSAGWEVTPMIADGALYVGTIPAGGWNDEVRYFITALDIHAQETQVGSLSTPYNYFVFDTVDPTLILDMPSTADILTGQIVISMMGEDPGSDISTFEITVDEGTANADLVYSGTSIPAEYVWDTALLEDGVHNIFFSLADQAGNVIEYKFEYTIKNRGPAAQGFVDFFQHWGALVGAVLAGAGIGAFYFFRWRKGKVA